MDVLELTYLFNNRNVPGRSQLLSLLCQPYTDTVTDPGGGATAMGIALPPPNSNFVRMWDQLDVSWTNPVATNRLRLHCKFKNAPFDTSLWTLYFGVGPIGSTQKWPVVGSVFNINNGTPASFFGINPLLVGVEDVTTMEAIFTAASGQTCTLHGRYCDLPI